MAKLIIIRGPSGGGKSTVAHLLHQQVIRKTALIEQDHYRHQMFNNLHSELEAARQVMFAGILAALEHGYDVIVEGILSMGKYKTYFDELLQAHPTENYWFYLEVGFDETVRRHQTRSKKQHFGKTEMREWYERAKPTGYPHEYLLPEGPTAEQICLQIADIANLQLRTI